MLLSAIASAMEEIAPTSMAESWDNVGLLVGDPKQEIGQILLTIDYSPAVVQEGIARKCDLIIAYHPPIFAPLKRIVAGSAIFDAIRRGTAIYSPHTALDVAEGGTNDMLADALGMTDRKPLKAAEVKSAEYKLVVFVPIEAVDKVSRAIFEAGAGWIGNYSSCSFRSAGTGTFFGEKGSHPTLGRTGRLEKVDEIRLETIVPVAKADAVVQALRSAHPYEEPAFDLVVLARPAEDRGQGKIGSIPPAERAQIFERIKKELEIEHLLVAGPTDGVATRAAVCAGSCGDFLDLAIAGEAGIYLTGEMRHHDALKAAAAGLTVVCTLHSNSERAVLKRVKKRLEEIEGMPGIRISEADRDPFSIR
jgi:dinuclear metal center YbgI/SA1388 family protein